MADPLVTEVCRALRQVGVADGAKVLVACSGGPDSRALLELLVAARPLLPLELSVATVDHGLRAESAAEADAVLAVAAAHDIPATVIRLGLQHASMAKARQARYAALTEQARSDGVTVLAVAHTATDQAETFLHRLVRGTALKGLGAMAPSRWEAGVLLVRPLLGVSSASIAKYVADHGLVVARDPTNADPSHVRTRLRHRILPLLRDEHPDLDRQVAALCARLRDDEVALEAWASRLSDELTDGEWLTLTSWSVVPRAVQGRILRRLCPAPLLAVHLDALLSLAQGRHGNEQLSLPNDVVAERAYDRLRFGVSPVTLLGELVVAGPGIYQLGRRQISLDAASFEQLVGDGSLVLRPPRAGDRVPAHSRKLTRHLIDRKVPRSERSLLPILARRTMLVGLQPVEEVVWVGAYPEPIGPETVTCAAFVRCSVSGDW